MSALIFDFVHINFDNKMKIESTKIENRKLFVSFPSFYLTLYKEELV
jgi:hypothetical protein